MKKSQKDALPPLWNDTDAEPNQMLDTGALAGDVGFHSRVESVVGERQRRPRLTICFRTDPVLGRQSLKLAADVAQIPLTDDERAAVEDGSEAVDRLIARLKSMATPAGPTPSELAERRFIPMTSLKADRMSG